MENYVRLGKVEEKPVSIIEEIHPEQAELLPMSIRERPGPKIKLLATVDYTEVERLRLLIDAILHAVVYALEMESAQLELASKHGDVRQVRWVSETAEGISVKGEIPNARGVEQLPRLKELVANLAEAAG